MNGKVLIEFDALSVPFSFAPPAASRCIYNRRVFLSHRIAYHGIPSDNNAFCCIHPRTDRTDGMTGKMATANVEEGRSRYRVLNGIKWDGGHNQDRYCPKNHQPRKERRTSRQKSQMNHFRPRPSAVPPHPIPIKGLSHPVIFVQPERDAKPKLPSSSATIIISIYSRFHSLPRFILFRAVTAATVILTLLDGGGSSFQTVALICHPFHWILNRTLIIFMYWTSESDCFIAVNSINLARIVSLRCCSICHCH